MILLFFIISFLLAMVLYPASDKKMWKWFVLFGTFFSPIAALFFWYLYRDIV